MTRPFFRINKNYQKKIISFGISLPELSLLESTPWGAQREVRDILPPSEVS